MKINLEILGARCRKIRETILGLNQKELAEKLGTKQSLISRLEAGRGCSIPMLLCFLEFVGEQGLKGENIFMSKYDNIISTKKEDIIALLKDNNEVIKDSLKNIITNLEKQGYN